MTTNPQHETTGSGGSSGSGGAGGSGGSAGSGDPRTTTPQPREPEDVDSLLAETLRAESEEHFTWKEPERKPRWFERVEQQSPAAASASRTVSPSSSAAPAPIGSSAASSGGGPRIGQLLLGAVCLMLALWCLAALVFGVVVDPLLMALGLCTLGGLALVVTGLRPRRRRRL